MLNAEISFPSYCELNGLPLQNGAVYFGVPGLNPVTNPVTVFWDAAGTQPAVQPIKTTNGLPCRNGAPSRVWVNGDYSRLVMDSRGRQVIYEPTVSSLSSSGGSSLVGFLPPGAGAVPTTVGAVLSESVSVARFKLAAEASWDNAFARAIAYVVTLATAANRTYGLPSIEMPGGRYNFATGNVATFPWITFVSRGSVYLDFTGIPAANHGFICNNVTGIAGDSLKHPGNSAPWLDGRCGAIAVLGPGKGVSTGSAFRLGNFAAGGQDFRDASMANVVATGWGVVQEYGNFNTYLCKTLGCRFETNTTTIKFAGANSNSGERMVWEGCTLAGADTVLSHNSSSFDCFFRNCSFDFNKAVAVLGAATNFCRVDFDGCYFEGFDNYLVDGIALVGTVSAAQVVISFRGCTLLPRSSTGAQGVNSPSRPLFRGAFSLALDDIKARTETRPYLEDGAMIESTVQVAKAAGHHISPWVAPFRGDGVLNRDYDFQIDAAGTNADLLTAWDRLVGIPGITTRDIFDLAGKKVLRVIGASGSNTSTINFESKQTFPVRPGEVFWTSVCLNANLATGNITTQSWIEFFDIAGVSLGVLPTFAQYVFRDALNDATLPNFASGNDRFMDTGAFRSVAPKNAASAKMKFAITSFDGTVYVSRARAWRDS